jgi:hypothetical protein
MSEQDEKTKKLSIVSKVIVIFTGALWLIYDIFPAMNDGRNDTISETMRNWTRSAWVLPFIWGAITGHLFITTGQPDNYKERFYAALAIVASAIIANLVTHFAVGWVAPVWYRITMLFVGIGLGVLLWPQSP